jgi:hypothetical protein
MLLNRYGPHELRQVYGSRRRSDLSRSCLSSRYRTNAIAFCSLLRGCNFQRAIPRMVGTRKRYAASTFATTDDRHWPLRAVQTVHAIAWGRPSDHVWFADFRATGTRRRTRRRLQSSLRCLSHSASATRSLEMTRSALATKGHRLPCGHTAREGRAEAAGQPALPRQRPKARLSAAADECRGRVGRP